MREKLIRDERDDDTNENKYTNLIGTKPGSRMYIQKAFTKFNPAEEWSVEIRSFNSSPSLTFGFYR